MYLQRNECTRQINKMQFSNKIFSGFFVYQIAFDLNDQVIKKVATVSPDSFKPTEEVITEWLSPDATADFIAAEICAPSPHVNAVIPIAFLK